MKSYLLCAVAALPLLLAVPSPIVAPALAQTHPPAAMTGSVTVQNPWARASAGQTGNSAAFLTLVGTGPADRLVSASAPVATKVELHETTMDGNIMRMRPVQGIDVAPGKPAELKPGGLHIMLIGLTRPFRVGENFPLSLNFAHAAPVTVTVKVAPAGAPGPGGMHGGAHGH